MKDRSCPLLGYLLAAPVVAVALPWVVPAIVAKSLFDVDPPSAGPKQSDPGWTPEA